MKEQIYSWIIKRKMDYFVTLLSNYVNLHMVEYAKGKKQLSFINSKNYEEELLKKVEFLIPKFTYKEWLIILNIEGQYKTESKIKKEDIKINLVKFLKYHYREIYRLFDMQLYGEYQTRETEDITELILGQAVTINGLRVNIVLFYYKDGSRMCYSPETKNRVVVENIKIEPDSIIVTLHQQYVSKFTRWKDNILNMFYEQE